MMNSSNETAPGQLLRYRDIAAILGISSRTIQNWVRSGRLPAVRLGGCTRFDRADVDRLIRESKGGGR